MRSVSQLVLVVTLVLTGSLVGWAQEKSRVFSNDDVINKPTTPIPAETAEAPKEEAKPLQLNFNELRKAYDSWKSAGTLRSDGVPFELRKGALAQNSGLIGLSLESQYIASSTKAFCFFDKEAASKLVGQIREALNSTSTKELRVRDICRGEITIANTENKDIKIGFKDTQGAAYKTVSREEASSLLKLIERAAN